MMKKACLLALALTIGLSGCEGTETTTGKVPNRTYNLVNTQAGQIGFTLTLPQQRTVQALPMNTDRVQVTISSAKLPKPINVTITNKQFVNNTAKVVVDKLPLGQATVDIIVYDVDGNQVTMGNATTQVKAGQITPVNIKLVVKEETGGLAITVDTETQYNDVPTVTIGEVSSTSSIPTLTKRVIQLEPVDSSETSPVWADTGVHVGANQSIYFLVDGTVGYRTSWDDNYLYYNADGCVVCPTGALTPSARTLQVLARLIPDDSGQAKSILQIGRSRTITMPDSGTLQFGINTWLTGNMQVPVIFRGKLSIIMDPN